MSWWEAVPAIVAAVAMLLAPGAIVLAPLRLGLVGRAAAAGVGSVALIGAAGVVYGALGLPFAAWQPLSLALIAGAAVWLVDRRRTRVELPAERSRWRWVLLAWAAAAVVIAVVAFTGLPAPDRVSQTYDNVFHLSAVAAILDGGNASSLSLRTLIETDRSFAYYPAAWHSLTASVVQLSGAGPVVASNAAWLGVAAVVWVPGAAWLAQVVLHTVEPGRVAVVALPLSAAFGAMPFSLLSWGTLYPTFLATALLPAAIAVPVLSGRALLQTRSLRRWRATALGAAAILGTIAALAFAQPRVLASWALLLAPLAIATVGTFVRVALRAGGVARRRALWSLAAGGGVLALAAAAGFAYLVVVMGLFERPLNDRLEGPQAAATQTVLTGVGQALAQAWPTGVSAVVAWPSLVLAAAVLVGAGFAVRTRGMRWIVVSYVAVVALFALAAGSDDVVAKLVTALWYKDRYRLSSVVPVLGVVLATLGAMVIAGWIARGVRRREEVSTTLPVAVAWTVTTVSAGVMLVSGVTSSIGTVFRLPDSHASTEVVSRAQIEFMGGLGEIVPEDQRILGDPWDGSAWTQLFAGREPVFPHVNGQWDAARLTLAYGLDLIETDPAVCAALDELRVRHVLYNPHEFGGGDPSGNHFPAPHRAVQAGLFAEVAGDGESVLYRIDQCGPLP